MLKLTYTAFALLSLPVLWVRAAENTGFRESDLRRIDTIVEEFRHKYDIPGLSIALAKDGRQVFAKGYGYADKENKVAVTTSHLFRIASVSKPITSVAIFTLVEQGKLKLSDKVFGPRGILGKRYGLPEGFPEKGDVTIEQLLEHVGGGWPNDRTDPMFKRYDLDRTKLIEWALPRYELGYKPGEHYAYSNFGYLLLGRVIERISGRPYEDYVMRAVLNRVGISDMHIAGDTPAQRRPNEVVYYDDAAQSPYTCRVSRMDAHGGWIARPSDLLRLLVRVDGFATTPDILKPETIALMTTPSSANKGYAKGWSVNSAHNWWHTGSLPGTASFLVRAQNGFCWAIVMNRRSSAAAFHRDLDRLGWTILGDAKSWP